MKTVRIIFTGLLVLVTSACSFDKDDVDSERQKQADRTLEKAYRDCSLVTGGYSGSLTIGEKSYAVVVGLDCRPVGADSSLKVTARVIRTDIRLSDATLEGTYSPGSGNLLLNRSGEGSSGLRSANYEVVALSGTAGGGQISGSLFDRSSQLGDFQVNKDPSLPRSLSTLDICHPIFNDLRQSTFEISGLYESDINPDPTRVPPMHISIFLHPASKGDLALAADFHNELSDDKDVLQVLFVPFANAGRGVLYLDGAKSGISFELQPQANGDFSGTYQAGGDRSYRLTFKKTSPYQPNKDELCKK